MVYCTITNIQASLDEQDLVRFTDDSDTGEPDQAKITEAVEDASALIDSYISGRYGAALDPVPKLVRSMAVDIAIYKISSRKSDAPEECRKKFDDAVKLLQRIQSGDADIPGVVVDEDTGEIDAAAAVVSAPQWFSGPGDLMRGF